MFSLEFAVFTHAIARYFSAMDSPVNHAARDARWQRARQRLLSVNAPDTDAHDLLARVWDTLQAEAHTDAAALALLTLGDAAAAREALRRPLTSPDPHVATLRALLLARFPAWTADIGLTRELWPGLRERFDLISSAPVLSELANTAESIGERNDAVQLRARRPPTEEHWLADLIAAQHLTARSTDAVQHVLGFVHATLGAEPDAIRSRLILKPRLPEACTALHVTNLRLGSAALSVDYERAIGHHTFVLSPLEGAVPIRVIFEPAVPGDRVSDVTVDGAPATLDIRRQGNRLLCPVQLVLDRNRTMEIFVI